MLPTVPRMAKQLLKSHFSGVLAFLEDELEENEDFIHQALVEF